MATGYSAAFRNEPASAGSAKAMPGLSPQPLISAETPDAIRYVARQPILDAHGNTYGYELLFRNGPTINAFSGDGDAATRAVLDSAVLLGLDRLSGGLPAFVNCTREALVDRLVMVLPSDQTVLEILETLEPTSALFEAC